MSGTTPLPVVIDTGGQIYSKLDAINSSLQTLTSAVESNTDAIKHLFSQLSASTTQAQASLAMLIATLNAIQDAAKAPSAEIAALYSLIFGVPITMGVVVTPADVVTQLQNLPPKPGP